MLQGKIILCSCGEVGVDAQDLHQTNGKGPLLGKTGYGLGAEKVGRIWCSTQTKTATVGLGGDSHRVTANEMR